MNNKITTKFLIALLTILGSIAFSSVYAQADSSFSYQGELIDNGTPANDTYDFSIQMVDGNSADVGTASEHLGVMVDNGLFNLNVDLGLSYFDGYEDYFFEVSVRKTSVGGAYTVLSPLQGLQAVPLATNLVNGSATAGQVLTFNGFQWNPQDPAGGSSSPWTVVGSEINYMNNVGIGIANPATRLHVVSTNQNTAQFSGGSNMYVSFTENGQDRGYIGSYVSTSGTNDEDFEIGTHFSNSVGSLQFTIQNQPKMTIANDGKIGIGTPNPMADLQIDATADGDVMRVRVDNTTKFYIDDNGGVGVGSWGTPPIDGLRVFGDVKQPASSNGMMKYMVKVTCSDSGANIINSYNGVSVGAVTVASGASDGKCILTFPDNISSRYIQVSAPSGQTGTTSVRSGSCTNVGGNDLECARFNPWSGDGVNGQLMILVY